MNERKKKRIHEKISDGFCKEQRQKVAEESKAGRLETILFPYLKTVLPYSIQQA